MLLLKAPMLFVAIHPCSVRGCRKRKPFALLSAVSKVLYLQRLHGLHWNIQCFYLFSVSLPRVSHPQSSPSLSSFTAQSPHFSLAPTASFSFMVSLFFISLPLSFPSPISLSFHPRQFQFHIYYIFNSMDPIRSRAWELPDDAAVNMFHEQSGGSIGRRWRAEETHLISFSHILSPCTPHSHLHRPSHDECLALSCGAIIWYNDLWCVCVCFFCFFCCCSWE